MYGADCLTLNKNKLAQLEELQDILRHILIQLKTQSIIK